MQYTLMNARHEVLSFELDDKEDNIHNVRPLDGFAWAPVYFKKDELLENLLMHMNGRTINLYRHDADDILKAVGVKDPFMLSLRSYGLSLTDCYWYRPEGCKLEWSDVSCFSRKWDTSFGEAILSRNFKALADADMLTPDCTLGGISRKAWIIKDGRRLMLKAEECESPYITRTELLSARLTQRLIDKSDRVDYKKADFAGRSFIACEGMIKENEEFVPAAYVLRLIKNTSYESFKQITKDKDSLKLFTETAEALGVKNITAYYAKLAAAFNLSLAGDSHLMNFGFIRDLDTLKLRPAPLFDRGRSFGSFGEPIENGNISVKEYALSSPKTMFLIMLLNTSIMQPEWDYSWYDKKRLDGFKEEIAATLHGCEEATDEYIKLLQMAFEYQLNYVNKAAGIKE